MCVAAMDEGAAHEHFVPPVDFGPVMTAAKAALPALLPEVQFIQFSKDFSIGSKFLFQASDDLIGKIERGKKLIIRGEQEAFAVLCTDTETFELKSREISNCVLISPDVALVDRFTKDGPDRVSLKNISSLHKEFLEIRLLVPRLETAKRLLEEDPFSGFKNETFSDAKHRYTFASLLDKVQSSEEELRRYLNNTLMACEIDGYWRLLEPDYVMSLIERVIDWTSSNSVDTKEIPTQEAQMILLSEEPESVMKDFFWIRFAENRGDSFCIRDSMIRQHFARCTLIKCKTIAASALSAAFKIFLGADYELEDLSGIALRGVRNDKKTLTDDYFYFPKEDLSFDPEVRFEKLFQERSRWTKDALIPYIEDVLLPGQTVDQLLYKHARTFVDKSNLKRKASEANSGKETSAPITYFVAHDQI